MRELRRDLEDKHERAGRKVARGSVDLINEWDLIDTGYMRGDVRSVPEENEVSIGTTIQEPNWEGGGEQYGSYPAILHAGFTHHITGEFIGPFPFLTKSLLDSIPELRKIYSQEIR